MIAPPPGSTLFPYTTLFRSWWPTASPAGNSARASDAETSATAGDRKSTRLNSSHRCISYAVFCLKKKNDRKKRLSALVLRHVAPPPGAKAGSSVGEQRPHAT